MTSLRLILPTSALMLLLLTPATSQAVCCGAECCFIDGACRGRGDDNPANACQECDPSESQSAWTDIPGCVPPDAGSGSIDAGVPPTDAGTSTPDAGTSADPDAGTSADPDAGSVTPMDGGSSGTPDAGSGGDEGGGCAVHPGGSDAPLAALFGLALGVFVWRRRAR